MSTPTPTLSDPDRQKSRSRSTRRFDRQIESRIVYAIAAVSGLVAAATTDASPTTIEAANRLWVAVAVAAVSLAASRSRRYPWLWFTGVAAAASIGSSWVLVAVVALGLACLGVYTDVRNRILGAVIGGLGAIALLHLPVDIFHGASLLIALAAAVPVLVSGYRACPYREQRVVRRCLAVFALVIVTMLLVFMGVALSARRNLSHAVDQSKSGLLEVRQGHDEAGARQLDQASNQFGTAANALQGFLTAPARLVPVVSHQLAALEGAASTGEDLASTTAEAARQIPYGQLKSANGSIDLAAVTAMQQPAADAVDALHDAQAVIDQRDSDWLVPPISDPINELEDRITETLPQAELARDALNIAPEMLGNAGPRNYLVLFTSPSEARNLGGFVGSYGVLTADNGDLELTVSGSVTDILTDYDVAPGQVQLEQDLEFDGQYGRYRPDLYFQNLTVSPDMGKTAELARSVYSQISGSTVDGVIVIDPIALAALLQFTGPIEIDGMEEPLTADNAAEYLLFQQYIDFEGDRDTRKDQLESVGRATFERLTSMDLPAPERLGEVLGPVVDSKHLLFYPFTEGALPVMSRLGLTGEFAAADGSDLLSVRTTNFLPNKLDYFLHRAVDYDATFDPTTGSINSAATVTLRNDAPADGLPDYIIGAQPLDSGLSRGTTMVRLAIYSPLTAQEVTVDGVPVPIEVHRELGVFANVVVVTIPPGASSTVRATFTGSVDPGPEYRLKLLAQPRVHADEFTFSVASASDQWTPSPDGALAIEADRARLSVTPTADGYVVVPFERR